MLEEPMALIMNVALSSSWGATPPNPGKPCRGDGSDPVAVKICDEFPMYLKVDYIRLYQDLAEDLDADNYMQVGCDPESHPTKEWINGHIDEYQDWDNLAIDLAGGAFCTTDADCTVLPEGEIHYVRLVTGSCVDKRCVCRSGKSWGGPRCTQALDESKTGDTSKVHGYGPPLGVAIGVAVVVVLLTAVTMVQFHRAAHVPVPVRKPVVEKEVVERQSSEDNGPPLMSNYCQNLV